MESLVGKIAVYLSGSRVKARPIIEGANAESEGCVKVKGKDGGERWRKPFKVCETQEQADKLLTRLSKVDEDYRNAYGIGKKKLKGDLIDQFYGPYPELAQVKKEYAGLVEVAAASEGGDPDGGDGNGDGLGD